MIRKGIEIDADVVKACEAGATNIMYTMIRNQEAFFPSHEDGTPLPVCHGEQGLFELMFDMFEGREAGPMDHVILFRGAPVLC